MATPIASVIVPDLPACQVVLAPCDLSQSPHQQQVRYGTCARIPTRPIAGLAPVTTHTAGEVDGSRHLGAVYQYESQGLSLDFWDCGAAAAQVERKTKTC